MTLRIIQWATGGVGRAAVEGIVAHPELELVGCWVHSEEKAGKDVGELCGMAKLGVTASNDVEALIAMDADCVMYSPIMADPKIVERLLASGKNVVTPLNWFYPGKRDVSSLEQACQTGRSSLHGTGIHPGGITERFPLMISALSWTPKSSAPTKWLSPPRQLIRLSGSSHRDSSPRSASRGSIQCAVSLLSPCV